MKEKFIHEQIFMNPSENRDFILSLPPDLAYTEAQLWIHYDKATKSKTSRSLAENGNKWLNYLMKVCQYFDKEKPGRFLEKVYKPWEELILEYHPNIKRAKRLIYKD